MYCLVLYVVCGCMSVMHIVYVHMVEEKELGVSRVWQPVHTE